jgi:hypothetical protein
MDMDGMQNIFAEFGNCTSAYTPFHLISQSGKTEECVFEVEEKSSGAKYAVKTFKIGLLKKRDGKWDLDIGSSNIMFESRFALLANHPNILKAKEVIVGVNYIFMVTPRYFCTLDKLLLKERLTNPQKNQIDISNCFWGVLYAFQWFRPL